MHLLICYVRVSSHDQKDDLERQIKYMKKHYSKHRIIRDISSGVNMNRQGLNTILDLAIQGRIGQLVVMHKDRLTRFGFELIERILKKYSNGEIIIVNNTYKKEPKEELVEDVLAIMDVFAAKNSGMRKYHKLQNIQN